MGKYRFILNINNMDANAGCQDIYKSKALCVQNNTIFCYQISADFSYVGQFYIY